jgi:hypothetical protein
MIYIDLPLYIYDDCILSSMFMLPYEVSDLALAILLDVWHSYNNTKFLSPENIHIDTIMEGSPLLGPEEKGTNDF